MKKVLAKLMFTLLVLLMVAAPSPKKFLEKAEAAGNITGITATLSSTTTGATTNLTVNFTLGSGLSSGGKVYVSLQGLSAGAGQYSYTGISRNAATTAAINTVTASPDGQSIIGGTNADLTAGTEYTIKVTGLTNPTGAGLYLAIIWTTNSSGSTVIDGTVPSSGPMTTGIKYGVFAIGDIIYGQITKAGGTVVDGAGVQLHTENWASSYNTGTNNMGYYSFTNGVTGSSSWIIDIFPPMNAQGMIAPDAYSIPSYSGGALAVNRVFGTATKTISGRVTRESGAGVASASVNAFKPMGGGGGWSQATTDSNGNYTIMVGGGSWQVMVCPGCGGPNGQQATIDWAYSGPPTNITFASNTVSESQTVNFSVVTANSTIKGKILKPDGNAPAQGGPGQPGMGINIFSRGGFGTGSGLGSDGTFQINVPAGTYDINVYDPSGTYTISSISQTTIKSNQTIDLGTMTLTEKTDIIRGTVKTSEGTPVAGIGINAFKERGGGDFGNTITGADGSYQIKVTPGQWMVMAGDFKGQNGDKSSIDYVVVGGGRPVTVVSGTPSTVDFTATAANATISGTLVDGNGALIKDLYGFVMADLGGSASDEMKMMSGMGGGVSNGVFSFKVPAGDYSLSVGMPPGSNYTPAGSKDVSVGANSTASVIITMLANDATISGYLVDQDGNKVTNLMGEVFSTNAGRSMHPAQINPSDGSYTISVASAAGPWYLGAWTDPASGYFQEPPSQDGIAISAGQTITKNITLRKANATISGKVTDNNGNALSGVFVSADTRTLAKNKSEVRGPMFLNDNRTNDNGDYTLLVPAGTYYVNAFVPPERGLIPPKSTKVTVNQDATITANLQFRIPDSKIVGTVQDSSNNNSGKSALVWAYSEDGAYTETTAGSDGAYELKVTKGDNWHIGANTEGGTNNTDKYNSSDTLVATGQNDSNAKDITLNKTTNGLPAGANVATDVTSAKSVKLTDLAQIDFPANSLGTEGQAIIAVNPTAEVGHQYLNKPLEDKSYDITATNTSGSAITSLNSNATVTLPYDATVLDGKGLNETTNDVLPAYWNDTDGTWTPVTGATINKDSNTITFTTNHFTKYSLVAANDASTTTATTSSITVLPKTGNNRNLTLYLLPIVLLTLIIGIKRLRVAKR